MALGEPHPATLVRFPPQQWRYYPSVAICAFTSAFVHIGSIVLLNGDSLKGDCVALRLLVLIAGHLGIAASVAALIIWVRNCLARFHIFRLTTPLSNDPARPMANVSLG
jgi:hypothetical protein